MEDKKRFHSSMGTLMDAYMRFYTAKGCKEETLYSTLSNLDFHLVSINYDKDYINESAFHSWLDSINYLKPITRYAYRYKIANFCRYLSSIGHSSFIPIKTKTVRCNFTPYIFSEEEIQRIFIVMDNWRDLRYHHHTCVFAMSALLRLLYSTGMRINEALNIKNQDVDFKRHTISLIMTKNKESRLSPINESMEKVLRQYISYRDKMPIKNIDAPDAYLFVNLSGGQLNSSQVLSRFRIILKTAGIPNHPTKHVPRLHDIRHTTCTHVLIKMIRSGKDPYCCLPILSKFMGHMEVSFCEYYLRLTQNMYPELIKKDVGVTSSVKEIISRTLIIENYE